MITERKILDQVEIKANGVIFIQEFNQVLKDGVVIFSECHRTSVCPIDDVSSHEHDLVRETAAAVWTPERKKDYEDFHKTIQGRDKKENRG